MSGKMFRSVINDLFSGSICHFPATVAWLDRTVTDGKCEHFLFSCYQFCCHIQRFFDYTIMCNVHFAKYSVLDTAGIFSLSLFHFGLILHRMFVC